MTPIPDDIMKAAREYAHRRIDTSVPAYVDRVNVIARAIMAERERCARIADKYAKDDMLHGEARLASAYIRREIERGDAA